MRRPTRSPIAFLALLALVACAPEAPPASARPEDEVQDLRRQLAQATAEIDRLEGELEMARRDADVEPAGGVSRAELATCREDLTIAREFFAQAREASELAVRDAAEQRQGLERCVSQLNEMSSSRRIVVGQGRSSGSAPTYTAPRGSMAAPTPSPRGTTSRSPRPVRTLSAPQVQIAGEEVLVTANLWNPDDAEQTVSIEIALLGDGVEQDKRTQQVLVPANGDLAVSARFHFRGIYEGKTLAGRVRVLN